ncbi:hypothetical protein HJC23_007626 [Cyclotella cryptica]|uniref:Zinc finger ZPR1-type domain-containing protein n=1 Tax=Cyclotella cryptica TaxID=29204 RepID=A0ABD3QRQ7_9STRA|eukprot:CCRYP_002941-RA/>CCRYP_002941-RA protein AED:0.16 eAED:0.16 QI:0/-1/0/1/-1/1/1/0/255
MNSSDENRIGHREVLRFPTDCPSCHAHTQTDMCIMNIPHFKEVILMSMLCEHCGFKSSEIKSGGSVSATGTKITLLVKKEEDLSRAVILSDSAGVFLPELDLELNEGGLEGMYTTVEGLLLKIHDRLSNNSPFTSGDTSIEERLTTTPDSIPSYQIGKCFADVLTRLSRMAEGKMLPFKLVISDPLSNSSIGPLPELAVKPSNESERDSSSKCGENSADLGLRIEDFERTNEQNERLGLNSICTEDYQTIIKPEA